jgi:protoporphyrinogen IX oxidase
MIALVKLVHIAAVVVWSAGLVALPCVYMQLAYLRAENPGLNPHGDAVLRLQRAARLAYIGIISPAAFIAIASGIQLTFQRGIVAPWFSVKLMLVAGLVFTHTLAGITLIRLFERPRGHPRWRCLSATSTAFVVAAAIVTLTLAKPTLTDALLPAALSEPGALKHIVARINPWPRP